MIHTNFHPTSPHALKFKFAASYTNELRWNLSFNPHNTFTPKHWTLSPQVDFKSQSHTRLCFRCSHSLTFKPDEPNQTNITPAKRGETHPIPHQLVQAHVKPQTQSALNPSSLETSKSLKPRNQKLAKPCQTLRMLLQLNVKCVCP